MRSVLLCLTSATLVSACDQATTPPPLSLSIADAPATSGRVVRFQAGFFAFLNFDPSTNLQSVIGLPADPTTSGAAFCDGAGEFEILDWQTVVHGSGAENTLIQAGSVNVHVYDAAAFGAAFEADGLCAAVSLPRLAQGQARLQYTDDDFNVSGTRANAFGWRLHGILDDLQRGRQVRYFDLLEGVFRPTGSFDFTADKVRLTPLR